MIPATIRPAPAAALGALRRSCGKLCSVLCLCSTTGQAAAQASVPPPNVEPPRVIEQLPAEYPPSELEAKHEATVVLRVSIAPDGTVASVEVAESAGVSFDEAAIAAVRAWRFEPARRGGVAVASRIRVPFRFDLPVEPDPRAEAAHADEELVPTQATAPAARARPRHARPAVSPVEVTVAGERALRSEDRSTGDFRVQRDVLRAAPRKEGAEVLRTAPGLYIGRGEGPAVAHSYMLRGFDAEHGQDIEFRVGGIPINQPLHLHGQGYADLGFLIGEAVRELSVSEGVYDPRQGDFAVAGSIDIELGVEAEERGVRASTGYGSFDTTRQLLMWAPADADRESFGAAEYTNTRGFGQNRKGQSASAIVQHRFDAGSLRVRALGIAHGSRSDLAGVVRADDIEAGRVCFECVYPHPTAQRQNAASGRVLFGLFAEQRGAHGANAELGLYLDRASFRLQQNLTGFVERSRTLDGVAGRGDLIEQRNRSETLGFNARYRTAPLHPLRSAHGTIEVGADARLDLVEQSQNLLDAAVHGQTWDQRVDADVRGLDLGIWADLDWHLARIVHARVGLRGDVLSYEVDDRLGNFAPASRPQDAFIPGFRRSAFGATFGPRASADVRPLDWLALSAAYGEGYRSPQARTLDDGEQAPFTKVRSADLGARFDWGAPLRLSVGGYYTELSDDVAFEPEEGRLERIGATRRLGAALYFLSRPRPWLIESLSVTTVDATLLEPPPATAEEPQPPFTVGQRLPFVPPVVVRGDLGTEHTLREKVGIGKLSARTGLGLSFLSPRPLPYRSYADPVLLLDASVAVGWGPLDLTFELYNVANDRYAAVEYSFPSHWQPTAPRSRTPARHVAAGAPRSWMVTLGVTL